MDRNVIWRFALAVCLAAVGLATLLGLLTGAQEQVYAAPPQIPNLRSSISNPQFSPRRSFLSSLQDVVRVCPAGPPTCDYDSVQEGVSAAAENGVVQVAQGTYTDTNGDGVVVEITRTVTLQGGYTTADWNTSDPVAHPTVLDGEGAARVVYVAGGIDPVVEGFHIYNGSASGVPPNNYGGGVYVAGGEPVLRRNRIYSNTAADGAGLYVAAGSPVVQNNLVYRNQTYLAQGGGVYVAGGTPLLQHDTFYDNAATTEGGGMYVAPGSGPVVSATIFVNNSATSGGGLYVAGGSSPLLDYNDYWGNTGEDWNPGASAFTGTHSISADPQFVSAAGDDFRLKSESDCIGQVPITQTIGEDYEGKARPFGDKSDIGAHEFYYGVCFVRIAGAAS